MAKFLKFKKNIKAECDSSTSDETDDEMSEPGSVNPQIRDNPSEGNDNPTQNTGDQDTNPYDNKQEMKERVYELEDMGFEIISKFSIFVSALPVLLSYS